jgi:hypothetical protein
MIGSGSRGPLGSGELRQVWALVSSLGHDTAAARLLGFRSDELAALRIIDGLRSYG